MSIEENDEITFENCVHTTGLERYTRETRQKIVNNLTGKDLKILETFCTVPGTRNGDAKHAAFAMKRSGIDEKVARDELLALYQVHYPGNTRDIDRVIRQAYHPSATAKFMSKPRVIKPTVAESRANIALILQGEIEPLEIQPDAKEMTIREALPLLYGDDLNTWVCLAKSVWSFSTKSLGDWLELSDTELEKYQLRCANPMRKATGITKEGNDSERCEDNASESLDLLTYETDDRQISVIDQLRIINYLTKEFPLVSVCKSGNESIHATYSVRGLSDGLKQRVKDLFAALGGDTSVMETHHFMRTPNATRNDKKAKGVKQDLLWIDGGNRLKEADLSELQVIGIDPGVTDTVRTEVEESGFFQKHLGIDFLFNEQLGWLRWNGNHWEKVSNGVLLGEAKDFQTKALNRGEKKRSKMLGRKNTLKNIVDLTAVDISPELKVEDFDKNPFLLGVENGIIDLKEGCDGFRASERADMVSRVIGVAFDPDAVCPVWDAFIARIFRTHSEVIPYIQRFCGYCLTGDVSEQIFVFFYGNGSNGKSTFIKVLERVMGDYASKLPKAAYINTRNGKVDTALSHLENVRIAVGDELNERETLAEGTVKTLSGGDRLQARRLHQMEFEFEPTHKFIMFGNHKPRITGCDDGIWRRVHLVPFTEKITDAEKDRELDGKLFKELPGILNWMTRGCEDWQKNHLNPPEVMVKASEEYRGEEDIVQQFISECLTFDDAKARESREALYHAYKEWCEQDGASAKTKKHLLSALRDKGIQEKNRKFCCAIQSEFSDCADML